MNLLDRVTTELGVDAKKAEIGLGTLLASVRLTVGPESFDAIKEHLPHAESFMGRALMGGGRTGEIVGLIGAEAVRRNLEAAGYTESEIPRLGALVGERLREVVPPDVVASLETKLPLLRASAQE